jgi:hypothetical protein
MQRDREHMQHSMEIGAEISRTTIDAVMRIGHQAMDAYRQVATLQADATDRWLEQSVRITRVFYGDGGEQTRDASRDALASWNHVWERGLRRSFEATRTLAESMLKAQSEMIQATVQVLEARDRAMSENLDQLQRTAETATSQTAMAGSRAAQQASSSQPKKAA